MRPQPCAEAHRQLFNNNYSLLYHILIFNSGAGDRTRTYDPLITNEMLYQLSYTGDASYSNIYFPTFPQ